MAHVAAACQFNAVQANACQVHYAADLTVANIDFVLWLCAPGWTAVMTTNGEGWAATLDRHGRVVTVLPRAVLGDEGTYV